MSVLKPPRTASRMDVCDPEEYAVNTPVGWEKPVETHRSCVLCEYSDDTGGALAFLKQVDTALGGRTDDIVLGKMMEDMYNDIFYLPLVERGEKDVPKLTAEEILRHFTEHDINPLRVLRQDMVRLQAIQDTLCPRAVDSTGRMTINGSDARQWASLERMKMDLVRQIEQTDARISREMPVPPDL